MHSNWTSKYLTVLGQLSSKMLDDTRIEQDALLLHLKNGVNRCKTCKWCKHCYIWLILHCGCSIFEHKLMKPFHRRCAAQGLGALYIWTWADETFPLDMCCPRDALHLSMGKSDLDNVLPGCLSVKSPLHLFWGLRKKWKLVLEDNMRWLVGIAMVIFLGIVGKRLKVKCDIILLRLLLLLYHIYLDSVPCTNFKT